MSIESINNNVASVAQQSKATTKSSSEPKNQGISTVVTHDDTLSITSTAKDIKNVSESGSAEPLINESRVEEIKTALQSGSYTIDPERVAKKMMQLETNLPNTT